MTSSTFDPVIDEVPEGSGHFLCTGFSGHGFKLAPAAGLMTAELAISEPDDGLPHVVYVIPALLLRRMSYPGD